MTSASETQLARKREIISLPIEFYKNSKRNSKFLHLNCTAKKAILVDYRKRNPAVNSL